MKEMLHLKQQIVVFFQCHNKCLLVVPLPLTDDPLAPLGPGGP